MKKEEMSLEYLAYQNLLVYVCGTILIGICTFGLTYIFHLLGIEFWKSIIMGYITSSGIIMIKIIRCVQKNNAEFYAKLNKETDEFMKFIFDD